MIVGFEFRQQIMRVRNRDGPNQLDAAHVR
jgi:hypothetical protein